MGYSQSHKSAIIHHKFFCDINRYFLCLSENDTMIAFIREDIMPECAKLRIEDYVVSELDEYECENYLHYYFEDFQYLKILDLDENATIQISKKYQDGEE